MHPARRPQQRAAPARHAGRRHRFRTHRRPGRRSLVRAARPGRRDGRSAARSADARGGRPERRREPAGSCRTADRARRSSHGPLRGVRTQQGRHCRRIVSAETGGDYPRLKQGRLTAQEQQVARQLVQAGDLLLIDDGTNLTAEDIAETAPHMEGLALVVVDRLQAAHSARLPLSGERLPDASQVLAGLARTLHVPVVAVVDSDGPLPHTRRRRQVSRPRQNQDQTDVLIPGKP
ncbi:DnaB-like helicase C-terminal domain-containing protein [Streptomyces sp. NPDC017943]|uniref:DnaB-like helicase C-terminal domain-containing protein n=1 Tax=Streptomyces sp. NPDC017943 TaxID=3365019 RepID=UPI0037B7FB1B